MEPHVFCGPEFILEVPSSSVEDVLERVEGNPIETDRDVQVSNHDNRPSNSNTGAATSPTGWMVQRALLLRIQTEIYDICTAEVRRQIHAHIALRQCVEKDVRAAMGIVSRRMANYHRVQLPADYAVGGSGTGSSSGGAPPPPSTVAFVQARPTHTLNAEEASSIAQSVRAAAGAASPNASSSSASTTMSTYVLLYVTDSRAAAQLHMLCLRNTHLALPHSCRLLNYYVFGGRAAAIVPAQVLQKRESLHSHMNFDEELWGVLEEGLTRELVEEVRAAAKAQGTSYGTGRLLTAFEQHEEDVGAVLHYCEQKVRYAGVFDDDEKASPFLIAMGLCWRLHLTMDDVCRHFARHPRRVIRALALYLARYTLAPEEYVYFFLPSLTDEVIIACTEDAQVTYSMKELSRQLLTKNDVVDAWLPMLAKFWQDHVVAPSVAFMEACWKLQGKGSEEEGTACASASSPSSSVLFHEMDGVKRAGDVSVRGGGRGIAATFGFRSIAEIAEHAAQHSRVLVPQSMATILKRRRGIEQEVFGSSGGGGAVDGDARDDGSDDDDFLIHVDVQGDYDAEDGRDVHSGGLDFPSSKRPRGDAGMETASRSTTAARGGGGEALTDPHRRIMREGLKLTLSLLGRRKLFHDKMEHYIEF
jgi:hypothetical protein